MKSNFKIVTIILLLLLINSSCDKDENIDFERDLSFTRGTNLRFYFSDNIGTDLLDLKNNKILPIPYETTIVPIDTFISNDSVLIYNECTIRYNNELGKFYWNISILGTEGITENQFYVKISENDVDTFNVEFTYYPPPNYLYKVYIDNLYYNGKLIMQEKYDENYEYIETLFEKVFIQKNYGVTIEIDHKNAT